MKTGKMPEGIRGNQEEMRQQYIKLLESEPMSIRKMAREAGISYSVLGYFIEGKRYVDYKNHFLLLNYLDRRLQEWTKKNKVDSK